MDIVVIVIVVVIIIAVVLGVYYFTNITASGPENGTENGTGGIPGGGTGSTGGGTGSTGGGTGGGTIRDYDAEARYIEEMRQKAVDDAEKALALLKAAEDARAQAELDATKAKTDAEKASTEEEKALAEKKLKEAEDAAIAATKASEDAKIEAKAKADAEAKAKLDAAEAEKKLAAELAANAKAEADKKAKEQLDAKYASEKAAEELRLAQEKADREKTEETRLALERAKAEADKKLEEELKAKKEREEADAKAKRKADEEAEALKKLNEELRLKLEAEKKAAEELENANKAAKEEAERKAKEDEEKLKELERAAEEKRKKDEEDAKAREAENDLIYWTEPEFFERLSNSASLPKDVKFGLSAFYKHGVVGDKATLLKGPTKLLSRILMDTVEIPNTMQTSDTLWMPTYNTFKVSEGTKFTPTNTVVILRPKMASFDNVIGALILQNLRFFDNTGNDVTKHFRIVPVVNELLPFDQLRKYMPKFTKKPDDSGWNNIFTDDQTEILASLEIESGIEKFASLSSKQNVGDTLVLNSADGKIINTVFFEYDIGKAFSSVDAGKFSNGTALLERNIRDWINFCMANTTVCLINTTDTKPRLVGYRTLGAMPIDRSNTGIYSVNYFPLVVDRVQTWPIVATNIETKSRNFVSLDTYFGSETAKGNIRLNNVIAPLDYLGKPADSVPRWSIDNPLYEMQLKRQKRYYAIPAQQKITIYTTKEPLALTTISDFASLRQAPTGTSVNVNGVSINTQGVHGTIVQDVPAYYRIIKRGYKLDNSPQMPGGALAWLNGSYTTNSSVGDYNTAEKFHMLEDGLFKIKAVTEGLEYVILDGSYKVGRSPDFSAVYPPEPIHVVVYNKDMKEIATFQAVEFNSIRLYVVPV